MAAMIWYKQENTKICTLKELEEDILYKEYLRKLCARDNAAYEFGFVPNEYDRTIREIETRLVSHISPNALWTWESGGDGKEFLIKVDIQEELITLWTPRETKTYNLLFDFVYPNGYRRIEVYDFEGKSKVLHLTLA